MCAAKKKTSSSSSAVWLGTPLLWLFGRGRPVLVVGLLVGLFCGGAYWAWHKFKPRILASPEFRVGPEQVEIVPPPGDTGWIHTDLRAQVFRDPTLDGTLSLLDDDLVERIARAFASHPWVAKVVAVRKRHPSEGNPASVQVELAYRKPACMVEISGILLAVDVEGVLLPSSNEDFSTPEAARYPCLQGVDRGPTGPAGSRWADPRVIGAAQIAAALEPAWERMRLWRIVPLDADPTANAAAVNSGGRAIEPFFVLRTKAGTQILWGYAPDAKVLGELPVGRKIGRLERYWNQYDSLDGPQGKPQQLDVRLLPDK